MPVPIGRLAGAGDQIVGWSNPDRWPVKRAQGWGCGGTLVHVAWEFVVDEAVEHPDGSFHVYGTLNGQFDRSGEAAELRTSERVEYIPVVHKGQGVRMMFHTSPPGVTKSALGAVLILWGLPSDQVPAGAVIRGPVPQRP